MRNRRRPRESQRRAPKIPPRNQPTLSHSKTSFPWLSILLRTQNLLSRCPRPLLLCLIESYHHVNGSVRGSSITTLLRNLAVLMTRNQTRSIPISLTSWSASNISFNTVCGKGQRKAEIEPRQAAPRTTPSLILSICLIVSTRGRTF